MGLQLHRAVELIAAAVLDGDLDHPRILRTPVSNVFPGREDVMTRAGVADVPRRVGDGAGNVGRRGVVSAGRPPDAG